MTCPHCQSLAAALSELLSEYTAERDCLYESSTDAEGRYSDPDDERAVREMDEIIDRARAALGVRPTDDAKQCPSCGLHFSWFLNCPHCGAEMENRYESYLRGERGAF